jgi:aminopeptidase N
MKQFLFFTTLFILFGCGTSNKITVYQFENELLDTLVVRADKLPEGINGVSGIYRSAARRYFDLTHTELDIDFDFSKRRVNGLAKLTLTPYFYSTDVLSLDAVNFKVNGVYLCEVSEKRALNYKYDGKNLNIQLDREYQAGDTLSIAVDYLAHPELNAQRQAYAIGSDQGLFFIDPDGTNPLKPTQVWTQGETEYNSRWFPTIDKPNERCTQELRVTVDESFITLSNGTLVHQNFNGDNTRTDTWKLDQPHAPYLFALVVGKYAVENEQWNGKDIGYYVYPEYRDHAKKIFDHTPEMLSFFSSLTGVDYPWPKYSQVIVADFVSGAMENTTSVVYAEGFQKSKEDLVDFPNDMIVAHEMFHHWFGNLVTCESWSNITLNEGFANYAEYLWQEYKYGKHSADFYLNSELNHYLSAARSRTHPLIDFSYDHKDNMFDAHSYNKGGLILHMLRDFLGDEAFFSGLNHYLTIYAYKSVEAHDLRLAFEEISGQDLNWFFNQWFYDKGHPVIDATYSYSDSSKMVNIQLDQIQDTLKHRAVFQFPFEVQLIFPDGSKLNKVIWVNGKKTNFQVKCESAPVVVLFNPNNTLLCELKTDYSPRQSAYVFRFADHVVKQYDALVELKYKPEYASYFVDALNHSFWGIRLLGMQNIGGEVPVSTYKRIKEIAQSDNKSLLRKRALLFLNQYDRLEEDMIIERLSRDSSAMVISYCLDHLFRTDHPQAERYASRFINSRSHSIEGSVASILGYSKNAVYLDYFESRLFSGNLFRKSGLLSAYSRLLKAQNPALIFEKCTWLHGEIKSMDEQSYEKNIYKSILTEQLEHFVAIESDYRLSDTESENIKSYISGIRKMLD